MDIRIIEWAQQGVTVINPFGLSFAILMWILILALKREYKVIPFILIGCYMTVTQRLVIFDIDFPFMRIGVIIGLVMVMLSGKYTLQLNKIDKVMIAYMVSSILLNTVLIGMPGFIQKFGNKGFDAVLAYFLFRYIFEDINDYNVIFKVFAVTSILVAVFMLNEKLTGRNLFSIFGGPPEYTFIREGRLRAQAAFSHPILAGTFGALLIPFMWILWKQKKRAYAIAGTVSGLVITFSSASSGPVLTLMAAILGIFLWKFKEKQKYFIPIIIISIFVLQLVMKAPIWFIFARIDLVGGSTGYHRSLLIDQAIKHFPNWMLYGTMAAGQWGSGLQDITNQYLVEGFQSGFLTLFLFVYIIKLCFNSISNSLNAFKDNLDYQFISWGLGVHLFADFVSFWGVSYFGHIELFYYMVLAMIASLKDFMVNETEGIKQNQNTD